MIRAMARFKEILPAMALILPGIAPIPAGISLIVPGMVPIAGGFALIPAGIS